MISHVNNQWFAAIIVSVYISINGVAEGTQNLSCYQCTRTTNTECSPDELLPCPSNTDRCVTHIMKDDQDGFKLKRECGLGPCTFSDLMSSRALGIDVCDRSRHEYFCIFCCRESGCNKASAAGLTPTNAAVMFNMLIALVLNITVFIS